MIIWPAILKYSGDSELTFVSSQSQWDCDTELHCVDYDAQDILIDSAGAIYSLIDKENNVVSPVSTNCCLSLQQVIDLAKAHLSGLGSCCVSKLSARTIEQAIETVGETNEH